jgi:hypothetical protein
MTLEERLALAREIAARAEPQFVVDNWRRETKQRSFTKTKKLTKALRRRKR